MDYTLPIRRSHWTKPQHQPPLSSLIADDELNLRRVYCTVRVHHCAPPTSFHRYKIPPLPLSPSFSLSPHFFSHSFSIHNTTFHISRYRYLRSLGHLAADPDPTYPATKTPCPKRSSDVGMGAMGYDLRTSPWGIWATVKLLGSLLRPGKGLFIPHPFFCANVLQARQLG